MAVARIGQQANGNCEGDKARRCLEAEMHMPEKERHAADDLTREDSEDRRIAAGKPLRAVNDLPKVLRRTIQSMFLLFVGFLAGMKSTFGQLDSVFVTTVLSTATLVVFGLTVYYVCIYARYTFPMFDNWVCGLTANMRIDASRFTKAKRPKRIILIRHGQSIGNANKNAYKYIPDNKLTLTSRGYQQALAAGRDLKEMIGEESIMFFVSPYVRTRQTLEGVIVGGGFENNEFQVREDPRLREQEFGNFQDNKRREQIADDRLQVGRFWYRVPEGESGADVYDRVTSFLHTLHRELDSLRPRKKQLDNVAIVSHGLAIRLFCMRYLHWTVEEFENVWNPHNCEMWVMEKNGEGRYELVTPIHIGKEKDTIMPLSMRVPHRELGQDLEAYLDAVKQHSFSSPLLDGIEIDPGALAADDPSDLRSQNTIRSRAQMDMKHLEEVLSEMEKENAETTDDDNDKEDSVFTLKSSR
mmetsp:Transcript_12975/g.39931  ORF Transcript_12975/g.39931 Transcript_12975/m.39931 type:complete len:470 (+) Transcript_12975:25-1434(+)